MDALVLENITKSFNSFCAVDELSARVPAGSIYGFLGPNGAGKTTTLRMIMNIISPDSGRIEILGRSPDGGIAEKVGYLPEERGLYRKMKIRALLAYFGALKGMNRHATAREIPKWLDKLGLSEWADHKVENLSRGMQQKLQFIVTAINDPEILILDEPFSGLDPVNLDLLKGIILRMREEGKTVIFSTHMMEQAEKLCDFIFLINHGKKVVDGSLDRVLECYRSNAVLAEVEGETDFIEILPMVRNMVNNGRILEIHLENHADPQDLLRALVDKVRVRSFREKVPSLHEVFVQLVGDCDA